MGLLALDHRICLRQGGKAAEGKDGSCGDGGNRIRKGAMNRTDPCGDLQTAAEKQPDRGRDLAPPATLALTARGLGGSAQLLGDLLGLLGLEVERQFQCSLPGPCSQGTLWPMGL